MATSHRSLMTAQAHRTARLCAAAGAGLILAAGLPRLASSDALRASHALPAMLWSWLPMLLQGFWLNIAISVLAMALGTVLGLLVGCAGLARAALPRRASWLLVQFFRNSPWLVLVYFTTYLMPFEFHVGRLSLPFPDWVKAMAGLALPVMANVAEIFRGAVQSIPSAQWESAASLAFTRAQTLRWIILPQCVKRMLPPWMNLYAVIAMGTVLASIVGVSEVLSIAQQAANVENRVDFSIAIYGVVLLLFFLYCYPIALWTRRMEKRFGK